MSTIRRQNEINVFFNDGDGCVSIVMFDADERPSIVSFNAEHSGRIIAAIRLAAKKAKDWAAEGGE